jgi:hypothetical protein
MYQEHLAVCQTVGQVRKDSQAEAEASLRGFIQAVRACGSAIETVRNDFIVRKAGVEACADCRVLRIWFAALGDASDWEVLLRCTPIRPNHCFGCVASTKKKSEFASP